MFIMSGTNFIPATGKHLDTLGKDNVGDNQCSLRCHYSALPPYCSEAIILIVISSFLCYSLLF